MKIVQGCYCGPESPSGPKRGFILTIPTNVTCGKPNDSDIRKALENAGFEFIANAWTTPKYWGF